MLLEKAAERAGENFAACQTSVFQTCHLDAGAYDGQSLRGKDILDENEQRSFASKLQFAYHALSQAERMLVVDFHTGKNRIYAVGVHAGERQTRPFTEFVACHFQIMKIVGIVDNPFGVDFIVTHFHRKFEYVIIVCMVHRSAKITKKISSPKKLLLTNFRMPCGL